MNLIYPLAAILSIAPLLGGIWNIEVQTFLQSSVLIIFFSYLCFPLYSKRVPVFFLDTKTKVIGLLLFLSAISLVLSPIRNLITGEWLNLAIGFLIIILSRGLSAREEERIFKFIVFFAYLICAVAFYEILFKGKFPPSGTLVNSNVLALFSLMIIPFALSIKKYALAGIVFIVLLLTASLAGFMAFAVALLVYLGEIYGLRHKKFIIPLISFCLIIIVYVFAALDFKSVTDRLIWWQDGFKVVLDRIIIGFGFGSFSFIYPAYHEAVFGGISSIYAHNYFLEFLAENGIVSSLIWFSFLIFSFIKGRPIIKYSILAVVLHSFVDFGLSLPFNFWIFCFILGINNKPAKLNNYIKPLYGRIYGLIILCLLLTSLNYGYKRLKLNGIYEDIMKVSQEGKFTSSLDLIDKAIIIDKNNPLIYKLKGDLYLREAMGKKERLLLFEAAAAFETALLYNPYDKVVYKKLLEIYGYAGKKRLVADIKVRQADFLK
ncbi:MAG: O-antigen ligase family protein [Elusimicrobiota bacterium]|nr:O-antigen ligase family protein [Elusimicrobiota bacterium]